MAAAHQQFAVQYRRYIDRGDDFGETCRNIVARARIEPRLTAGMDDLHADAVPFPLGGIVRHVDHRLRSEEHTSELQSLMRNSYAVFCLKKKNYILRLLFVHLL